MYFTGKHITLRALEPSDLDWLVSVENNEDLWHVSDTHLPYSRQVLARYIQNATQDIYEAKQMRLVIDYQEKSIGLIDLFDFDPFHKRAGVGISILQEFQQKNLGSEALGMLTLYAFKHLKLHQLYANIGAENIPSLKLFQKLGFEITGTKKDWNLYDSTPKNEHFLQLINPKG